MLFLFAIFLHLGHAAHTSEETKVPIVGNHNNQLRLKIGERLRLECPVHSTSSGAVTSLRSSVETMHADDNSPVLYHWQVGNRLDYMLDSDPRYRFNHNRRVLELTVPVEVSDSGTYRCTGVTGFGKREVIFEVHVRDPDVDLLCATAVKTRENIKAPCFLDPTMKRQLATTIEQSVGNSVKFDCEADGTEPIRYRWFMGNTVADWITNSHGARGPVLTIDHVGREHTGHYTCQVSNLGGSLNYTYRLVVTELPSASPKIVGQVENYTFYTDSPAIIVVHVRCACEEPLIQWLKRIELNEEARYEQAEVTTIPLPNARDAERNERFVVLGSWKGSPATIDSTVSIKTDEHTFGETNWMLKGFHQTPSYSHWKSYTKQPTDNIYVTKLQLTKPLNRNIHAGKYIVMTMSLSDVKNMEYGVIFVNIMEDPTILKGRKILIYFLVPFCSLFAVVGTIAYIFVCRQRGATGHSLSSSNDRHALRSNDSSRDAYQVMVKEKRSSTLPTSSRHSSSSHITNKHQYLSAGVQSPLFHTELMPNAATNGFGQNTLLAENGCHPVRCTTESAHHIQPDFLSTSCLPVRSGIHYNDITCPQSQCHGSYVPIKKSSHRILAHPPALATMLGESPCGTAQQNQFTDNNEYFDPSLSGAESANSRPAQYPPSYPFPSSFSNLLVNTPFAQPNVTHTSFDQYSAISQSPMSSSTLTNHYTAPFVDNARDFVPERVESLRRFQPNSSSA